MLRAPFHLYNVEHERSPHGNVSSINHRCKLCCFRGAFVRISVSSSYQRKLYKAAVEVWQMQGGGFSTASPLHSNKKD
eukprot:6187182-Pleurochrysis_carterae.AAC.1